jgi:hypothetical protein
MHPQSRVQNKTKHTSVVTTVAPESPGIPARNGFNGFLRALPGDRACLTPSPADKSADLTPTAEASGPHDFSVRSEKTPLVKSAAAAIASRLAFVTIASAPW